MTFRDIPLGKRLYDPVRAKYLVKQSEEMAAMITGTGDATVSDEFETNDIYYWHRLELELGDGGIHGAQTPKVECIRRRSGRGEPSPRHLVYFCTTQFSF